MAPGDEGDEHKCAMPSAISAEQHKEITVRQILHHLGLFPSDAALESKIIAFFAQRTALALSHVSHLTDTTDLSCFVLDAMSHGPSRPNPPTNWFVFRFSSLTLFNPLLGKYSRTPPPLPRFPPAAIPPSPYPWFNLRASQRGRQREIRKLFSRNLHQTHTRTYTHSSRIKKRSGISKLFSRCLHLSLSRARARALSLSLRQTDSLCDRQTVKFCS